VNHNERVSSALAYAGYDRIPVLYQAETAVTERLMQYLHIANHEALLEFLGDDFRYVQPVWRGPAPRSWPDGSYEIGWPDRSWQVGTRYKDISLGDSTYPEVCYRPLEGITDPDDLARFQFPTADWFDYSTIKRQCERVGEYAIITGRGGILDFINGISLTRGMEQTLVDLATMNPVLVAIMDVKFRFHYETFERVLQAAEGLIDIVLCGEDLGSQNGLLISPRTFDRLFAPKFEAFYRMVHSYGAKVMMHSCGSVRRLIPRLIELGLDILNVVQVSTAGMDIRELQAEFGHKIAFCGSMCVQTTLPHGSPDDVRREVALRRELFPDGGLILAPTHTIEPDTPTENILAMYEAAGSLQA
jgi:uroporphyrinogen decarboxylase